MRYLLDTNVVSEAMKPDPHPAVRAWLNDQVTSTLYLPSVTIAELTMPAHSEETTASGET